MPASMYEKLSMTIPAKIGARRLQGRLMDVGVDCGQSKGVVFTQIDNPVLPWRFACILTIVRIIILMSLDRFHVDMLNQMFQGHLSLIFFLYSRNKKLTGKVNMS